MASSEGITQLDPAGALTGTDPIAIVQGGVTVRTDVDAVKAFIDASPTMTFKGQADASAVDEAAATGTSIFQNGDVYRINVASAAPHAFSDISEDLLIGDWVVFNGTIFQKQDGTDPTAAETKTAYESNADTNAFDDAAVTKLGGIEALADVTDPANVNAAGAVMETDYNTQTVLLAVADDTPLPVTVAASSFVGRKATGDVGTMTDAEARTVLNVEDGSTADQTDSEIKTAYENNANTNEFSDFEQTKLDDINDRGFNIQTSFFDNKSFSTASQDTGPAGFAYNNDGTRLWLAGGVTDTIYEYDLSTPYRPSTATFNGVFLSISAQEGSVSGITINPDGTKFFICGSTGDEVNQYSFGSPFALTGASFDNVTVSVSSESTIPRGLQFSADGNKLFIIELTGTVFQYTVITGPFDLSGGISLDTSLSVSTEDNVMNGLVFKEGGRKLYLPGAQNKKVYQYDLPIPYRLTGGSFDNISFDVSSEDTQPVEVLFDPNGSNMAIIGNDTDSFYEYELDSDGIFTDAEKLKLAEMAYAKRTASAKQTITGGGALILAHNLSGTPTLWYVILENKETEHNFSPGDQTRPSAIQSSSNDQGVGIVPDGSDLNIRYGSGFGGGSSVFSVVDQTTGDVEIITNSKWEAIFVAAL